MAGLDSTLDFQVRMRLDEFYAAYEGLEVLAGLADVDSRHVANILLILNASLRQFLDVSTDARNPSFTDRVA